MENWSPIEAVLIERSRHKFNYITPCGLRELMSDISREVLRYNPKNICAFIADYLDALLITRENARVACKTVERVEEKSIYVVQLLKNLKISYEQAMKAAGIIQKTFRKYKRKKFPVDAHFKHADLIGKILRRCKISLDKARDAAVIIQRAYRSHRAKQESNYLCGNIKWWEAASRAIRMYRDIHVPRWEMERAATLIQAAYKGYYTRKMIKEMAKQQGAVKVPSGIQSKIEGQGSVPCLETSDKVVKDYNDMMNETQNKTGSTIEDSFRPISINVKRIEEKVHVDSSKSDFSYDYPSLIFPVQELNTSMSERVSQVEDIYCVEDYGEA